MLELFLYSVFAFGLAVVLGHSTITQRPRQFLFDKCGPFGKFLVELLECPTCAGWHMGWILVLLQLSPTFERSWKGALIATFYTAGSNYLLARLTGLTPAENANTKDVANGG